MSSTVQLATGLAGAIGSDFRSTRNQLVFVEFGGKVSRINLVPASTVVSNGTGTLHGTWLFDLQAGAETNVAANADIWWEQQTNVLRSMVPQNGAQIVNLGAVSFTAIGPAQLLGFSYGVTPIDGNNDASNLLVAGDVFAVRTRGGYYAKVQVITYGYDLQIRWTTYRFQPRYQVLGTGYNQPEDIVVGSDERTAYVTERSGNLLRIDLTHANRPFATVVTSGLTAPHQIALDEARHVAYVVEFASPGRLLRIDLTSGTATPLATGLDNPIGLLVTADGAYAYVSEQAAGGGRLSIITLATGHRETLVTGLANPFFLTWSDPGEAGILVPLRDPANQVALVRLTQAPPAFTVIVTGTAFRPSSVAVVSSDRLLLAADSEVDEVDLAAGVFTAAGPILLGIGLVPISRITRSSPVNPATDGYADTSVDPAYFFQVKDAPFGSTLALMFNHDRAFADGARFYRLYVDGAEPLQAFSDYWWSNPANSFILRTTSPSPAGYYPVRSPGELWFNHFLGYLLDTSGLSNGLHTISVRLFASQTLASEIGSASDDGHNMVAQIDNGWPQAVIDQILHDGSVVGTCAIVDGGSHNFTFNITATDAQQHMLSWNLVALWGDNQSKAVASDNYSSHVSPSRKWAGTTGVVPAAPWDAGVGGDPTSLRCAHTFRLGVWDRVTNGYGNIHYSEYNKSITLMLT